MYEQIIDALFIMGYREEYTSASSTKNCHSL